MKKLVLASLLSLTLLLILLPVSALAAETTTYEVSTAEDFIAAVDKINNAISGSYVISLQDSIDLSTQVVSFTSQTTTTILGNGHTLTTFDFASMKSSSLNLGKEDGSDTLTMKGSSINPIVYAIGTSKLHIYSGVTLCDNAPVWGSVGGIQIYENAECHMYGGMITNCNGYQCGGVLLDETARFYMYGGTISNCGGYFGGIVVNASASFEMTGGMITGCNSTSTYGGGITVDSDASFEMTDGKITRCTGVYGGGILSLSSNNTITGGEISGNSAELGGGLYLQGSATINGVKIYNNAATSGGDDIVFDFSSGGTMNLEDVPSGLILDSTNKAIDGWYKDYDPRWSADNAEKVASFDTTCFLKAAHGLQLYTVTFEEGEHGTLTGDRTFTIAGGNPFPTSPVPVPEEHFAFDGWADTGGNRVDSFPDTVAADATYTALWKRISMDITPVEPKAATYCVEHYLQQLDGSYQLVDADIQQLFGEIGANVTATPKTYEHYHFDETVAGTVSSGEVVLPTAPVDGKPNILTLKLYYKLDTHTLTYDLGDGTSTGYDPVTAKHGTEITIAADKPTKDGYQFTGWIDGSGNTYQPGASLTVTGDITLTAQWRKTGGGDDESTTYYILHYESNGGTKYKDERYAKNTVVQLDKVPVREGYQFTGWYADKGLTEKITSIKMTSDKTVYAGWCKAAVPDMLNGDDHFAYVIGYTDGTVRPNANISRSEVAAIFFRLLKPEVRDSNLTSSNTFTDVNEGMWCNMSISTMAKLGVVKGRSPELFDPNAPITRAEFAAICARFDTGMTEGDSNFTDISGHWAEAEIERAASLGWIMGYTDGTFRPDNYITRAEAMTMINRVLCRIPEDEDDLLLDMNVWPDNQPGAWYYLAVQEATNSHDFRYKSEIYEHWIRLTADPDWTRYQD